MLSSLKFQQNKTNKERRIVYIFLQLATTVFIGLTLTLNIKRQPKMITRLTPPPSPPLFFTALLCFLQCQTLDLTFYLIKTTHLTQLQYWLAMIYRVRLFWIILICDLLIVLVSSFMQFIWLPLMYFPFFFSLYSPICQRFFQEYSKLRWDWIFS